MKRLAAIGFVFAALGVAACGSDDDDGGGSDGSGPDAAAMTEGFAAAATDAYEAEGEDRDDFSGGGLPLDDCFTLSAESQEAVLAAIGQPDATFEDGNFLFGQPGEEETLNCGVIPPDAGEAPDGPEDVGGGSITAGTTTLEPDQVADRYERSVPEGDEFEELEGEAPGLDSEDVVAFKQEGAVSFAWVSDDFIVSLSGPSPLLEDRGFDALSVAVEEVSQTLTASD